MRRAEKTFDPAAQAGQLADDRIGQGLTLTGVVGRSDRAAAGLTMNRQRFGAQGFAGEATLRIHHIMVRFNLTGDERLAQAQDGVNDHFAALAVERIGRKEDAGCRAGDHLLHHDGQRHALLVNPVARAIPDGARRPQAAPAVDDRGKQGLIADDVQVGVLLASKGEIGQVFSRGG